MGIWACFLSMYWGRGKKAVELGRKVCLLQLFTVVGVEFGLGLGFGLGLRGS